MSCIVLATLLPFGTSAVVFAAGSPATANPSQLFGVHPLEQGSTTLPGGHFNYALLPGQSVADGIVVENFSDHTLTLHVYSADLVTAAGGGLAPAQPTATMHQAGAWITVAAPMLTVFAHSEGTDNFTLRVPGVVSPGQHLGALVAAADVGTTAQGSPIEARVALITVVTVPGVAHASGRLSPLMESTASAPIRFGITLINTGNLLLTYAGSVVITSDEGHHVATLALTPASAYVVPDGRVSLAALWNAADLPSGSYRAQAHVVILAAGTPVGTLSSQSLTLQLSASVPALFIAACALLLLTALLLAVRLIRRHKTSTRARAIALQRLRGVR